MTFTEICREANETIFDVYNWDLSRVLRSPLTLGDEQLYTVHRPEVKDGESKEDWERRKNAERRYRAERIAELVHTTDCTIDEAVAIIGPPKELS
jgi:hypothetical protein